MRQFNVRLVHFFFGTRHHNIVLAIFFSILAILMLYCLQNVFSTHSNIVLPKKKFLAQSKMVLEQI